MARDRINPLTQTNDTERPKRYYVILSTKNQIDAAKVTICLPIKTIKHSAFSVEIKTGSSGLIHKSFVSCTDLYTLPVNWFVKKQGFVDKSTQSEINFKLKTVLELF